MFITKALSAPVVSSTKSQRLYEVDFLRAISFITVVAQHSIGIYANRPGIPKSEAVILGLIFVASKFAVPMFVFLSGLSLFYQYNNRFNTGQFLRRRAMTILLPYLAWTVLYTYYSHFGLPGELDSSIVLNQVAQSKFLQELLHNMTFGTSYYHMWFVVMIFQFYLLFPLLLQVSRWFSKKCSRQLNSRLLLCLNVAWVALLTVKTYVLPQVNLPLQLNHVYQNILTWSDREFLFYLGYFILGAQAGVNIDKWRKLVQNLSYKAWTIPVICYCVVSWEMLTGMSDNHLNFLVAFTLKPEVAVLCFGELLLLYRLSLKIPTVSFRSKFLLLTSKYSFGSYFIHAAMLQILCLNLIDVLPLGDYLVRTFFAIILASGGSVLTNQIWNQARKTGTNIRDLVALYR